MILAVAALLPAILGGTDSVPERKTTTPSRADEVREAVLRDVLEAQRRAYAEKREQDWRTYYVEVEGADPSKWLLAQFQYWRPRVMPASAHSLERMGAILSVGAVQWENPERAKVWFEFLCYGENSGTTVVLEIKDGAWVIVGREGGYIALQRPCRTPMRSS